MFFKVWKKEKSEEKLKPKDFLSDQEAQAQIQILSQASKFELFFCSSKLE